MVLTASQVANATWHDRLKGATRLIADIYVPGKIFHATGHVFAGVVTQSKKLRNLENVAAMIDEEFGFEKIVEEIIETTKKLEPATPEGVKGQMLTEFMKAESAAVQAANIVTRPFEIIINEIRNIYNGVIPFCRKDLKDELTIILKEIQSSLKCSSTEKIKRLYGQKMIGDKLVKPNFDHVFKFEFKIKESTKAGGYVLELKGGHVAEVWESLERLGLVKILNKEPLATGAINYIVQDLITGKELTKTVFAPNWTKEKIAEAMWEVYKNPSCKDVLGEDNVSWIRYGIVDNFEMKLVLRNTTQTSGNITRNGCDIVNVLPYK